MMKRLFFLCIAHARALCSLDSFDPYPSLVEIVSTTYSYHSTAPWSPPEVEQKWGAGIFLGKGKILTAVEAVRDAETVYIRCAQMPELFAAEVVARSFPLGLALVEVDEDLSTLLTPLSFSQEPYPRVDNLHIYGYFQRTRRWYHSKANWFVTGALEGHLFPSYVEILQVPFRGFSPGSAVFAGDQFVGIVAGFGGPLLPSTCSLLIPASDIYSFVQAPVRKTLPASYQNLTNPALRTYCGMPDGLEGIRILEDWETLEAGDLLLAIDGHSLNNQGLLLHEGYTIAYIDFLLKTAEEETVLCKIVRAGERKTVEVPLAPLKPTPSKTPPHYYVYAGLLFACDQETGKVLLKRVLPDAFTLGYEYVSDVLIDTVNDQKVYTLQDVSLSLENHGGAYHQIRTTSGNLLVLDRDESTLAHPHILKKYGIESERYPHG
ncbi:MAG: hypothetical protein AAGF04_00540 [Chlamydiota bacterium]